MATKKAQPKRPRNRKAQEATLINNDARKKEIAELERAVKETQSALKNHLEDAWPQSIQDAIDSLKARVASLEGRANE